MKGGSGLETHLSYVRDSRFMAIAAAVEAIGIV